MAPYQKNQHNTTAGNGKKKTGYWLMGIHTSARTPSGPLVAGFFNLSIIIADKTGLVNKTCRGVRLSPATSRQ